MEHGFIDILQTMVKEQGKDAILDTSKCKAFLADYTRGEHKKESRLLMQALEAKVQKAISTTHEIEICKKQQVRLLHEEHFMVEEIAIDLVDTLMFVIKGVPLSPTQPAPQSPPQNTVTPQTPQPQPVPAAPTDPLLERAFISLEYGEWKEADGYCEQVLNSDPKNAMAYIGKLCAELKIKKETDLANHKNPLDSMPNYQKALRFSDPHYHATLTGYNQAINGRIFEKTRKENSTIPFGPCEWRVLDVQNDKALILSENIIEKCKYNEEKTDVTWETCTLREYLNDEFLQKFTGEQQRRIVETRITNNDNLWYGYNLWDGMKGGNDTTDKIWTIPQLVYKVKQLSLNNNH